MHPATLDTPMAFRKTSLCLSLTHTLVMIETNASTARSSSVNTIAPSAIFGCPWLKNLFIATSVDFVEWVGWSLSVTAASAACAYRRRSLKHTNALRTSTRTTAPSAAKTCFRRDNLRRTSLAAMLSTRTASENLPALTIDAPFAKRRLSANKVWPLPGKRERGTLPNTPCRRICNERSILCVMTVKRKHTICNGTFLASNAHNAALSTPWWNKLSPLVETRRRHPHQTMGQDPPRWWSTYE